MLPLLPSFFLSPSIPVSDCKLGSLLRSASLTSFVSSGISFDRRGGAFFALVGSIYSSKINGPFSFGLNW
jgi:hypothetical protein